MVNEHRQWNDVEIAGADDAWKGVEDLSQYGAARPTSTSHKEPALGPRRLVPERQVGRLYKTPRQHPMRLMRHRALRASQ